MQAIPPYGFRANYSTAGHYPTAAYPITTYGANDSQLATILPMIQNGKVRSPTDMANLSILVLDSIGIETGKYESNEKKIKLTDLSLAADTTAKKVAIMQRLATLSKDKGAQQTNSAIRNGFAYEFYCNVEAPGVCARKSEPEIKKDLDDLLSPPFYTKPIFYVPVAMLGIGVLFYAFSGE